MILQNNYYENQQEEDMEALEGKQSSEIELSSYRHCVNGVSLSSGLQVLH